MAAILVLTLFSAFCFCFLFTDFCFLLFFNFKSSAIQGSTRKRVPQSHNSPREAFAGLRRVFHAVTHIRFNWVIYAMEYEKKTSTCTFSRPLTIIQPQRKQCAVKDVSRCGKGRE